MMTLRELQTQLMTDYGITAKWVETGGGQWALESQVGDSAWIYIGAPTEFPFANELDIPVATVSATLYDSVEDTTDSYCEDISIGDMARMVASDMLSRTGMLHP